MKITRRNFIKKILYSVIGLTALGRCAGKSTPESALQKKLTSLFNTPESAVYVGAEYLKAAKENAGKVFTTIASKVKEKFSSLDVSTAELKKYFDTLRQRDFDEGRLIELKGWFLSVTEAQLCAAIVQERKANFLAKILKS